MIEKYSRLQMATVWSEERKIALWLKVEIAVCEAWAEDGVIPLDALPAIRKATVDLDRMRAIEQETEHDVIAFLRAAGETVGPDVRWVHLGLTSSDVIDTALSLAMSALPRGPSTDFAFALASAVIWNLLACSLAIATTLIYAELKAIRDRQAG